MQRRLCLQHTFAKPLTKLTTIWLDNVMNGVPPGDVTGCPLFVIVPRHGHLAIGIVSLTDEVLFRFSGFELFFQKLTIWFVW